LNTPAAARAHARGNTLVLVTAILVLLVIVATAFLVRAQSGRAQASAQQKATGREARVDTLASNVAQEVADALFVKRIDPLSMFAANGAPGPQILANQATGLTGQPIFGEFMARSDFPRLPPEPLALRYGVDYFDSISNLTFANGGDGYLDGYNYAPYSVNPFTNWPARYGTIPGEGNPIGNPGFGDNRWLASTEPVRALTMQQVGANVVLPAPPNPRGGPTFANNWGNLALDGNGAPVPSPEGLGFSHWSHLSWLPTAENGFRVCWDISNVEGNWDHLPAGTANPSFTQRAVAGELNLGTPYEQWLPFVAPREPSVTGKDARGYLILNQSDWQTRVNNWFNVGVTSFNNAPPHAQMILGSFPGGRDEALPNFLQLGAFGDPSDEFKLVSTGGNYAPSSRNLIGRTLADADGDGWTDSFWFVAPTSSDRNTRQLVAVRIMDNSALVNINVATRSDRSNTIGQTPADLALATRGDSYDQTTPVGSSAAFRDPATGFFNARENDPEYRANFKFTTALPAPGTQPSIGAANLLYAVASNGSGVPTGGVDVGWAPERWEGRRTQPAAPGSAGADVYQNGFLRALGVMQEGTSGQVNATTPFFDTSADFGTAGSSAVYGDAFVLSRPSDRLSYFKAMANGGDLVDPITTSRVMTLTPFGSDDEVELRGSNGLNSPQTASRLESSLNSVDSLFADQISYGQFMRSSRSREETARFFDPDDVRVQDWRARRAWTTGNTAFAPRSGSELLLDHRRLMTTLSGARNETLPPRLWTIVDHTLHPAGVPDELFRGDVNDVIPAYSRRGVDFDRDGDPDDVTGDGQVTEADDLAPYHPNIMFPGAAFINGIRDANGDGKIDVSDFERARQRFLVDNRKLDLRRPNDVPQLVSGGTSYRPATTSEIAGADAKFSFDLQRIMRRALLDERDRIVTSGTPTGKSYESYFGQPGQAAADAAAAGDLTKMMIASFAANTLAYRDGLRTVRLNDQQYTQYPNRYLDQPLHPQAAVPVPPELVSSYPSLNGTGFIGVEKQPFIQEVFLAFVYPKSKVSQAEIDAVVGTGPGTNPGCPDPATCTVSTSDPYQLPGCAADGGEHFVVYDPADAATWPAVVFVVQLANPFNEPVKLEDFELRINPDRGSVQRFQFRVKAPATTKSGNIYGPDVELGPCTPEEPRTAIVFALPEKFPNGEPFPRDAWLDFLDIGASIDTDGNGSISTAEADPSNDKKPGQAFAADTSAIFAPAWGTDALEASNRRGGTLFFDATRTTAFPLGLDVSSGTMANWKPDSPNASTGGTGTPKSFIELRRRIFTGVVVNGVEQSTSVVVDRFENELDQDTSVPGGQGFTDLVLRNFLDAANGGMPPPKDVQCRAGSLAINGIRLKNEDYFVAWARGARQWLFDTQNGLPGTPLGRGVITQDERTPRYAFARNTGIMASCSTTNGSNLQETIKGGTNAGGRRGEILSLATDPDGTTAANGWINVPYYNIWGEQKRGKPTFFPTRIPEDNAGAGRRYDYPAWSLANSTPPSGMNLNYGEKGVTIRDYVDGSNGKNFLAPYRLFQKDADFDQVAEILDVPMWGPLVQTTPSATPRTYATLAEILAQPNTAQADHLGTGKDGLFFPKSPLNSSQGAASMVPAYGADQVHYNRLRLEPAQYSTTAGTGGRPNMLSGVQTMPPPIVDLASAPGQQNGIGFNSRLPGGAALLDAFVVDDRGAKPFDSWEGGQAPDGAISFGERASAEDRRVRLARNFEGKLTPGLININTAPVEVMRAMPQMLRLSYDDDFPITKTADSDPSTLNAWTSGVATSALGKRRLLRDPTTWQAAPYDTTAGLPSLSPPNPQSILFDYGIAAPRVRVPEAIELWRNKGNVNSALDNNQFANMPSYFSRGLNLPDAFNHREWCPDIRSERGFDSLGELAVLTKGAEFSPPSGSDADGNGIPDVQDIAAGKVSDVNRNNVADSADVSPVIAGANGTGPLISWNQAQGWSMRFAGLDPYRTKWDDPTWGAGLNAPVGSGPQSMGGTSLAYRTEGIPKNVVGSQVQSFPLVGRTAIDKHLLTVATDDLGTPTVVETDDPSNNTLGSAFIETKAYRYDQTAGDAVEQNQLLKGISNLVTTRSDVFTVWLRIRTIKQDPLTGQWNGTDPEFIVDDSRYMMTVDRSSVDRPGEQPRIVSFVKVSN
jgi:hypothetical protein